MDKEEILKDFLNTLKISFKNASIYGADHPAFSSSIVRLKQRIEMLFKFFIPITMGFTSRSVYMDGRFWEKGQLFLELAKIFHFRKLKSIEIQEGITADELVYFITKLSISPRDVIRKGGPNKILTEEALQHLTFEELDYSELLKGEGEEIKEIWLVLLQEALETKDDQKMLELADSFEKVIKAYKLEEISESEDMVEAMSDFFTYLEDLEPEKYKDCAKEFVRTIMRHKKILSESEAEHLKKVTHNFKDKDLASTMWEEILTDENFDSLNFNIFSTLIQQDTQDGVSHYIGSIFRKSETLRSNPKITNKMEELLADSSSPMISEIYRNTLATLLREISFKEELSFREDVLAMNYRYMLLNLIEREKSPNETMILLKMIFEEWENIAEQKDYECLKALYDILKTRIDELSGDPNYLKMNNKIVNFVERRILEGELSFYFDFFIEGIAKSTLDVNVYLDKIFTEGKITPYTLKAFFKFFKEYLFYFNLNLDTYSSDSKLAEKLVNSLGMIDSTISHVTLKNIFQSGERVTKIKVLQAMQHLSSYENKFLIPILKSKDFQLKSEAFVILMGDDKLRDEILQKLFSIPSPFGIRNKRLLENLAIVEEKEMDAAKPYLINLSEKKHFWNKKLRERAKSVLEKWYA
ncbi:MAG: hypothetical protein PVH84_16215 [Candidatus Aminicenantes bacterium]|jgi:hypothetical protein